MKKNSETHTQIYLVSFLRKIQARGAEFTFFHIPNGGARSAREASVLKMAGVLPGVYDLCFLYGNRGVAFVEMKSKGGKTSADQKNFGNALDEYGIKNLVIEATDASHAISQITPLLLDMGVDQNLISSNHSSAQ